MTTIAASATLPLTTIFTAPTSCYQTISSTDGAIVLGAGLECIPSGAGVYERSYAFSPALNCPHSFTTAMLHTTNIGHAIESRAVCCPVLDGVPALSGNSMIYNPESTFKVWFSSYGCTLPFSRSVTLTVSNEGTMTTRLCGGGINAYSVQIAWQASDLPTTPSMTTTESTDSHSATDKSTPTSTHSTADLQQSTSLQSAFATSTSSTLSAAFTTSTTSELPITSATPFTSSVSSSSSTPLPSSIPDGGLSTGTKIAIGVLAPLAGLALLLAAILLIRYRRRIRSHGGPGIFIEETSMKQNHT